MSVAPQAGGAPSRAGGGAARRAEAIEQRLIEKRVRLAQVQEEIAHLEAALHSWRAGAEGERQVAAVLDGLRSEGWVVLHDVRWPGRQKANLDHVAIGPGGVVVVDAKNWAGAVTVTRGVLRVGGYGKKREAEAAAQMAAAVSALLAPEHRSAVRSAICLVGQPLAVTRLESGAVVVGLDGLGTLLQSMPAVLGLDEVLVIASHLERALASGAPVPAVAPAVPTRRSVRAERSPARGTGARRRRLVVRLALLAGVVAVVAQAVQSLG